MATSTKFTVGMSLLSLLLRKSTAQHTEAVCVSGIAPWTSNSLGQSPCLVAAYLGSVCSTTGDYDVPSIGPGFHYSPSSVPSSCECTSVMYSLYSACAYCQNATIDVWSDYHSNCSSVAANGAFPFNYPPGTAVPQYAFQDIETTNRFNITQGQATGDTPESVAPSQSSTASRSSGTSPSPTTVPGPGPTTSSPTNNKKSAPIGAIVGGVVGGIAVIAAILAAILLMRKRNKKQQAAMEENVGGNVYPYYPVSPNPVGNQGPHQAPMSSNRSESAYNPLIVQKPYDPDDPSTFPPTAPTSSGAMSHNGRPQSTANSHAAPTTVSEPFYTPTSSPNIPEQHDNGNGVGPSTGTGLPAYEPGGYRMPTSRKS